MKPALHRSLIFWSGILVMLFIVWAWSSSTRRGDGVRGGAWRLHHWASGVAILHEPPVRINPGWFQDNSLACLAVSYRDLPPESSRRDEMRLQSMRFARPGFYRHSQAGQPDVTDSGSPLRRPEVDPALCCVAVDSFFRTAIWSAGPVRGVDGWVLFIPHWMLLAAFASLWTGVIVFRERKRKRQMREMRWRAWSAEHQTPDLEV